MNTWIISSCKTCNNKKMDEQTKIDIQIVMIRE